MKPRPYEQCTRCVMDTSDPEITFDGNDHCNHCTEFLSTRAKYKYHGQESDRALDRLVDDIKRAGRGNVYNCIIGMSGGVDSSYGAYLVKQKGLRPLAVHMDNGWDSENAVINIRNVTNKLGIDYESYVLDWEEFKDLQVAFLKASVPEAETPTDVAIPVALHYFAAKYNVKYIISAGNLMTEGILPKSWHYNAKDLKYFNHIQKTFGAIRLRKFENFDYKREMYFKLIKGIRMVYPINYVSFLQDDVAELLREKFDYRYAGGKHYESRYTRFIQSFYLYEKFGIDYRRATLSSQICNGQIDRETAIDKLKAKPYDAAEIADEKQYISKKLGISNDEFESIIARPPKWYWEYPNDDIKLGYIYTAYRKLFKREKLASV